MNLHHKKCFVIHQSLCDGTGDPELLRDCRHHGIPTDRGLLLAGRLCEKISLGDILFTADGAALTVKGLFAYGRTFEALDAGMTCTIFMEQSQHLRQGDLLYR